MKCTLRLAILCLLALPACKNRSEEKGGAGDEPAAGAKTDEAASDEAASDEAAGEKEPPPPRETKPLPADPGGEHQGTHQWSLRFGGTEADAGRSLASDADGGLAAVGYVKGKASFGGVEHEADGSDAYVARYSPEGELRWVLAFGGPGDDVAEGVALDADGNAIVVGAFAESLVVGGSSLPSEGADDIFVLKLDPKGKLLWGKRFGGRDVDAAHQVAVDGDGNVFLTGVIRETVLFGKETLKSAGGPDAFLLKLDPSGEVVYAKSWGKLGKDYGRALALDSRGDVILLAEFTLGVDFGGGALENAGNRDIALVKLTGDGEHVWSKSFGNDLDTLGIDVAIDPADNVLMTGAFDDVHAFGGSELRSAGSSDVFIAKYDPNGRHLWSHGFGSKEDADLGAAVAADPYGNVYATGWFWKKVDFGGGELESAGYRDAYLLKLSPEGEHIWSKHFGGKQSDFGRDLAVMKDGGAALLGTFYFTTSFGGQELTAREAKEAPVPKADVFLARFSR